MCYHNNMIMKGKKILTVLSFLFIFVPLVYFSFTPTPVVFADGRIGPGNTTSVRLNNPLKNGGIDDIPSFVKAVLEIVMKIGVPLVAVAIIYTGYLFIAAQGKPEKLAEAKKALGYVFLGALILLGAYVIAQALQGTINAIRGV